jgi:hypothetical protein
VRIPLKMIALCDWTWSLSSPKHFVLSFYAKWSFSVKLLSTFLMDSPFNSSLWAFCNSQCNIASAKVGSAIKSCHFTSCNWVVKMGYNV